MKNTSSGRFPTLLAAVTIIVSMAITFFVYTESHSQSRARELRMDSSSAARCLHMKARDSVRTYRGSQYVNSVRVYCTGSGVPEYRWANGGSSNFSGADLRACGNPCR
jgi:hypothetical protein